MPQISPINWMLIISMFILAFMTFNSMLPEFKTSTQKTKMLPKIKTLKW